MPIDLELRLGLVWFVANFTEEKFMGENRKCDVKYEGHFKCIRDYVDLMTGVSRI